MNFYIIVETDTNICKIGVSIDIEERVKSLQTGNSSKLKLNSGFYCKVPYKLETIVKNYCKEYHRIGEWYNIEDIPMLIEFIHCKAYDLNNKYYTCDLCDFKTLYKTGYKKHINTGKHNKKEKIYIQTESISSVVEIIHGEKELLFKCRKCEKKFNRKCDLEKHLNKIFCCPYCNRLFKLKHHLKAHLQKKINCLLTKKKLNRIQKNAIDDSYSCSYCNREFKRNWDLKRHLTTCKKRKEKIKTETEKEETENELLNAKIKIKEFELQIKEFELQMKTK